MNRLSFLRSNVVVQSSKYIVYHRNINYSAKRFKKLSQCDLCFCPPAQKPCFDHRNVLIEHGHARHSKLIKSFLYTHYWPRDPSVVGLWMCPNSPYLKILSDKYCNSGDRYLAFEITPGTQGKKLVGVSVANKVFPWIIPELEDWAHHTISKPEQHRMYFCAHCLKDPDLFKKYNVDYIYNVEILGTASEVSAQGVATRLLQTVLDRAEELRYPLVQIISVNHYTSKICEKCEMKREWSMKYSDFVDETGRKVFFPRHPHHTVGVYVKYFDPAVGGRLSWKRRFL